jgi:CO/xanthine dehydrogenase FAD-binding subunit
MKLLLKGVSMLLPIPEFKYLVPDTLTETSNLLLKYGDNARVLAGGTDLLVQMRERKVLPEYLLDIQKIPDLAFIRYDNSEGLRIGALTSIQSIKNSLPVKFKFNILTQAAAVLSTPQIRNQATIGGNLANASPAAETAPALMTLRATVKASGAGKERTIPVENFFLGTHHNALQPGEVLTEIDIPNLPPHSSGIYLKYGKRLSDVATVGVGVVVTMNGETCEDVRIAFISVGPAPMRAINTEKVLRGQKLSETLIEEAAQVASQEAKPRDGIRGFAGKKREMLMGLVKQAIKEAAEQVRLGGN